MVNGRLPMFNCKTCTPQDKRRRGCVRPFKRKEIWHTDECFFCGGKYSKCVHCGGKGRIPIRQCPQAAADSSLLPFFFPWLHSQQLAWPDGRGRLFQVRKLVEAFDLLYFYHTKFEVDACRGASKSFSGRKTN